VTAFLYAGLGGRPFWNSALLAPRFIASAFITGPAFVIILLHAIKRLVPGFHVPAGPTQLLARVLRITILVNLFMLGSEVFTEIYAGGSHHAAMRYLLFGMHGKNALVPWIWTAIALNLASAVLVHLPASRTSHPVLLAACATAFSGVWIEKGMGLIIPGGMMVLVVLLKIALPVFTGEISVSRRLD
jgi:molybdopterin-containing oxidoreductase family membrane subunit